MRLAKKLINMLNRVFDKDPRAFLAFEIDCDGSSFSWTITDAFNTLNQPLFDDGLTTWDELGIYWDQNSIQRMVSILTITPVGGTGSVLTIDLSLYTLASLAAYIAEQPGYSVTYTNPNPIMDLSSLILITTSSAESQFPAGQFYAYTNVWWAYMDACAQELSTAQAQIAVMPAQMNTNTSTGSWLDFLGAFYGVPRNSGELDPQYAPRIVATVIRPLGNNIAIAEALRALNGGLMVTVTDYNTLTNNSYGLFDVNFPVSLELLNVTTPDTLTALITQIVNSMRDAGTFLRVLSIISPVQGTIYLGGAMKSGSIVYVYPHA